MSLIAALLAAPLAAHVIPPDAGATQVVMYERSLPQGGTIPWHIHAGIEATYVVSGDVEILRPDVELQRLSAGQSFIIPRGVPHSGKCLSAAGCRVAVTYIIDADLPESIPSDPPQD